MGKKEKGGGSGAVSPDSGGSDAGAKLFKAKCATCHTANDGGPNKQARLRNQNRQSGQVAGFKYTTMFDYLANPKKYIKGTNMAFPGFKKEKDRADCVAYLNTCK
ncbi:putative cytochrome c [Emiliania huxleyi CCMP1516]|uniref:Cytochrome c domain-containing protein n=2 Tax=Emiliania huxleyi TaxID=2903 RepID=A0A0D3II38_EMIH1|nr:putative cytochrome c [Emiliania huxleyi CCMP1516]EOD10923.1 putative cytochrome c [Emiliania huxleyi CCMP1516]|eukprot:XP_005763352.1 putative cytochrome c [Emiliania huxleyi CCMP1516]